MTPDWRRKDRQKNPAARHSTQSHRRNRPKSAEFGNSKIAPPEHFIRRALPLLVASLALSSAAWAMSPPYPHESIVQVEEGRSAPYVGSWALTMPTAEHGTPDTVYATCDKPVRIEAADDTHIFYLGPDETEADAAIELIANGGRTDWEPIAGGPSSFVIWVAKDSFHLYDAGISSEEEWAQPLIYARCAP